MEWINDISFVIDGKIVVLIEHQSTINPNMPLRMLIYIAKVYEKICEAHEMYSSKMMTIPMPEFAVLYNGKRKYPDKKVLKLSSMFAKFGVKSPINLELTVTVYNINKGRNPEFAERSTTLDEYEIFVATTHEYEKTMPREEALLKAVTDCRNKGILKNFLNKHGKEVIDMLLREFKMAEAQKVWLNDGITIGEKRGERRGITIGEKRGRNELFELWASGYSLEEAKKKFSIK
jgi:hypothetical protein